MPGFLVSAVADVVRPGGEEGLQGQALLDGVACVDC